MIDRFSYLKNKKNILTATSLTIDVSPGPSLSVPSYLEKIILKVLISVLPTTMYFFPFHLPAFS